MQGSYEYIATDNVARVFITVFVIDPSWVVGTKYFLLLMRVSFSYIRCMRPTRPDLPIGYVGLSLVPQDSRGASSKLCYAWSQLLVYDQIDKYLQKFYVLTLLR